MKSLDALRKDPGLRRLHKDFETGSALDLQKVGLWNYATHWSTHIQWMSYRFDNGPVKRWNPLRGEPYPAEVAEHERKGGVVVAYNALFEYMVQNHIAVPDYGAPQLSLAQMNDVMARACAMGLPPKLEKVAPALGLPDVKDMAGARIMKQMREPKPLPKGVTQHSKGLTGLQCRVCVGEGRDVENHKCQACGGTGEVYGELYEWYTDDDAMLARLGAYCDQDVVTETGVDHIVFELSPIEQEVWRMDAEINLRGLPIDVPTVRRIVSVVDLAKAQLNKKMLAFTRSEAFPHGEVPTCGSVAKIKEYLECRGVETKGLDKESIVDLLDRENLPADCRTVLEYRQSFARTSNAKFAAILDGVSDDGFLRGMFFYHGAGQTGRWAGRRIQVQNLPRWPKWFTMDDAERIIKVLHTFEPEQAIEWIEGVYGDVLTILPLLLRPVIKALPGHNLVGADAANIEGRGLAFQAGEQWKLDAFRDYDAGTGPDLYKVMASGVLEKTIAEIDEDERQSSGKVPELACGFGGGKGAFANMAKVYGVKVSDAVAERTIEMWRNKNPMIAGRKRESGYGREGGYWSDLQNAAMDAVRNPNRKFTAGVGAATTFLFDGTKLLARLPSGRVMCYWYPSIKMREAPWGEEVEALHFWAWDSEKNRWAEHNTYGGKLSNNTTQGICRDILAAAMLRLRKAGFKIVLHVHDEPVAMVPKGDPALNAAEFGRIASEHEPWMTGLPIVFKAQTRERYSK